MTLFRVIVASVIMSTVVSYLVTRLLAVKYLKMIDDYAEKVMSDINKAITEAISKRK